VEEAHNLVDRARDMYSAELTKDLLMEAKKAADKYSYLKRPLKKINEKFIDMRKALEERGGKHTYFGVSDDLIFLLKDFLQGFEIFQKEVQGEFEGREKIVNFFFAVNTFLNISDLYDEG
jgi:DNA excision repair protein ERCC-2